MEKIGSPKRRQPPGTVLYTVTEADTLTSIAAHFNMVVSELKVLNKLMGTNANVFPGQIIYVKPPASLSDDVLNTSIDGDHPQCLSRANSSGSGALSDRERSSWNYDETNCIRVRDMFCKVSHTRYITDGAGAVKGSLLLTVSSVIFDADKSDDLVKEGIGDYTVAVPIENVLQMAFYEDIAAKANTGKYISSIYRGSTASTLSSVGDMSKMPSETHFSENSLGDMNESNSVFVDENSSKDTVPCSDLTAPVQQLNQFSAAKRPLMFDDKHQNEPLSSICAKIAVAIETLKTKQTTDLAGSPSVFSFDDLPSGEQILRTAVEDEPSTHFDTSHSSALPVISPSPEKYISGVDIMLKASPRFNTHPVASVPRFTETGSFVMPSHWETYCNFDCGYFSVAPEDVGQVRDVSLLPAPLSDETHPVPTFAVGDDEFLPRVVEVDEVDVSTFDPQSSMEMTDLTSSMKKNRIEIVDATPRDVLADIFNRTAELLIRPSTKYTELPMYLCVRVGWLPSGKLPAITSPMAYGDDNHRLQPEYWFAIPKRQVEHVYQFIQRRLPEGIYGSDDEIDPLKRGFETLSLDELKAKIDLAYREQAIKENKMTLTDIELLNLPLPELSEPGVIMNAGHLNQLNRVLLPIAVGCKWELSYSSENHGYSLQTLYHKLADVTSPVLFVIKDMYNSVFGAMLPTKLHISHECYGSGEMFLFTFNPRFKKFPWTGVNSYFINSNAEGIYFGVGNGKCGLYIDAELNHGRSENCATFDNDPLEPEIDFLARQIEVWSFAV